MHRADIPSIREFMTRSPITLRPEMTLFQAAQVLLRKGISGAPVVAPDGTLLGLLSEFDCLRAVASSDYEMDDHDTNALVGDLMTREVRTVSSELDLFALAHEFMANRVHRYPVVEAGRLVGVVSRSDALGAALALRKRMPTTATRYPDYPSGRDPIRDYPRS